MLRRSRRSKGFTYLELLVVVAILAVIAAAIVPIYGASVSALQRRSVRGDLTATIVFLQEQAINEARELRLVIDAREGTWHAAGWVSGLGEEAQFEPLGDAALGSPHALPDSLEIVRVRARRERGSGRHYIAFYPSGACDPAEIRFGMRRGGPTEFAIETTGALGEVRVTP